MPSLEQVLNISDALFAKARSIIEKKGADYNRDQQVAGDTLFNLKVSTRLGVTETTTQGILVRLSDKFMRLISLTKTADREAQVKDESVADTIADAHNYLNYLYILWLEERGLTPEEIDSTIAALRPTSFEKPPTQNSGVKETSQPIPTLANGGGRTQCCQFCPSKGGAGCPYSVHHVPWCPYSSLRN